MKRYFDLNLNTDNNFCDIIDETFMVEIPNDGKPYGKINNEVVDISNTDNYKLSQFQKAIQYQHDAYNEYAREIVYQINYNTALGNTTLVTSLQSQLQAEQQAVIARINAITLEYNGGST